MARGVHSLDSFLEFKGRSWSEVHHDAHVSLILAHKTSKLTLDLCLSLSTTGYIFLPHFFPTAFFVVAVDIIIKIKGSTHKIIAVTICITECGYISHGFIPL